MSSMRSSSRRALLALTLAATALLVCAGAANAAIVLQPGLSLAEQFGYVPTYTQSVPAFDSHNAPAIRSRAAGQDDTSFVQRLEGDGWVRHDFLAALRDAYPDFAGTVNGGGWDCSRIVFDDQDRAYTTLTIRLDEGDFKNVMLYSLDGCDTWHVVELPFGDSVPQYDWRTWGNIAMEHFVGHNRLNGPPFLALWRQIAPWKGVWSSRNELYVVQPRFEGDQLVVPAPVLVSDRFLGMIQCAGGSSFAVTDGELTHFVYCTIAPMRSRTTPTYAATYDHATGTVGPSTYIGGSVRGNDAHDTPGICSDSAGYLHVVTGAHNGSCKYARSLAPHSSSLWTPPIAICTSGYRAPTTDKDGRGLQTYVSLVCGPNDTLHLVTRQTRRNVDEYYRGQGYMALSYQRLPLGGVWSQPQPLVIPAQAGYSVYYQKLTIDRLGRLFLAASYYTTSDLASVRTYRRFHHRMVLISDDGGGTWRFATTQDFAAGITTPAPSR
jgi:hypothetical protein